MAGQNVNESGNLNANVNDGDIGFDWEANSTCPTPSSDQAQKAAPVVVEVGEGSGKAAKKRRNRKGKKPVTKAGSAAGGEPAAAAEKAAADPDHELHNCTERDRRKTMKYRFTELRALLPHVPAKADKSTVVEEAASFIKLAEQKLQSLERQKLERNRCETPTSVGSSCSREAFVADQVSGIPAQDLTAGNPLSGATTFKTWTTPNMVLNLCGDMAQINICCPKRPGMFAVICFYLEKYNLQVIYATVSSDMHRAMFMIQAHASGGVEMSGAALSVEDLFHLALGEIMNHISTMM